jgi:hypothetical protein
MVLGVLASALNSSYSLLKHSRTTCLGMKKLQKPMINVQRLQNLKAAPTSTSKPMTKLPNNSKSQV